MSGRKPLRFAAVMALLALSVAAGSIVGTDTVGPLADFEWSAPSLLSSILP
ncbi:hypothetical protein O7606_23565 [Micromonospora sp. WMMD882]|uniref:hypothetical protein n=1 Tax=Micromonospora sp. WMMD882 TaxID=3015151 RepID=UPI00248D11BB|nr:hypothetical protein [Micromonospora sp. WMMD882]WBB79127.1 hypothetical protein O7606_23565 [Micromonospora sp. WMMD882]